MFGEGEAKNIAQSHVDVITLGPQELEQDVVGMPGKRNRERSNLVSDPAAGNATGGIDAFFVAQIFCAIVKERAEFILVLCQSNGELLRYRNTLPRSRAQSHGMSGASKSSKR